MHRTKIFPAAFILLMLVICSTDWSRADSPADTGTSLPVITAKINGVVLEIAAPNHVSIPATIIFTADKPVTIYYTTNGGDPATSTSFATISSANGTATGPTIDTTEYMLLTQGIDAAGSLTPLMTYTFVQP